MKYAFGFMAGLLGLVAATTGLANDQIITDAGGRKIAIPAKVERLICSGPGALRLLTYLQGLNKVVAVDDLEKRRTRFDARPYALANPQLRTRPVFGQFRGHDQPELIMTLDPQPQVIFKTYAEMGYNPVELQQKTRIPVVVLDYGDLGANRQKMYQALRIMGRVADRKERAEAVITFFESHIAELSERTRDIAPSQRPSCFVGGIAFKGPHGFQSTEPGYPPFRFVGAHNLAGTTSPGDRTLRHSNVSKEKIVIWDPDFLFMDLSSLQMGAKAGALHELRTDPAYRSLSAVKSGRVYGLLPYNWYTRNFGSILANAYYIGKLLYPDRFRDIDPVISADEICVPGGKAGFRTNEGRLRRVGIQPCSR